MSLKDKMKKKRYGEWAGNPKGQAYNENQCAEEVWGRYISAQCSRKPGHGPEGLYCKQHAKRFREEV